jgi:GT2 family glycosyltransferase
VRARIYKEVGGLDGRFFAHQEEIEMCWRMRIRGYQLYCLPESKVYHVGGGTLPKSNPMKTYLNFRNNLTMLYKCLPEKDLKPVMRLRWFLDYLAAFQTLILNRNVGDFKAIFRARCDFKRWRKDFEKDRMQIQQSRVAGNDTEFAPFLLLWRYYAKGRKTFSQLGL